MILKAFAVLRRRKYRELEEAWTKVAAGSNEHRYGNFSQLLFLST
jgi:hypothetical protein